MNTDHINYQQRIAESENTDDDLLKQQQYHSYDPIGGDSNNQNMEILTRTQRHERISTLVVIAIIALLTGVDYAIILPTAWGYINTFLEFHYGGWVMGLLLSVFSLSGAIAGLILGYLNDIGVSLKQLVLFGISFKIFGNILYFIGINIYVVVLARFITGIGMGLVPLLLAEISRRSTPETRTQLFTKVLGCRQIGLFLGPCFTILLKQFHFDIVGIHVTIYNSPGLLMAILWIIAAILTLFFFHDLPIHLHEPKPSSNAFHNYCNQAYHEISTICRKPVIMVLLITSFVAYFNQTALETTLTPFTSYQFHWHELEISGLFAIAGVEITIVYIVLHFATKKFSDQSILLCGYVLLSIACLIGVVILPYSEVGSTKYLPVFLLFVGLDILALPLIVVTSTSLFTQQTDDDQQGMGQGIQRFVISVATIVGPLFAGGLLQSVWTMLLTMLIIVVLDTILIACVYRLFRRKTTDELSALIPPVNNNN